MGLNNGQQNGMQSNVSSLHPAQPQGMKPTGNSTPTAPGQGNAIPTHTNPSAINPAFLSPIGNIEHSLIGQYGGNYSPGQQYQSQIAGGNIPPGTLATFHDLMNRQNASIMESMGGARFGSDIAGRMAMEGGRSLNSLLMGTENNALQAQGNQNQMLQMLMQNENQRNQMGQQMQYQDFIRQTGLPPQLAAILGLAGLGGGSSSTSGSGFQVGGNVSI